MKPRFLIFFLLILQASTESNAQVTSKNNYTLKIERFLKESVRGTKFWLVECTLTNFSKDTLSYLTMSCSWTDFYSVDKKEFEIDGFECDKNIPTLITIAPGESRQEVLRLFNRKNLLDSKSKKFKVGLNLIITTSTSNFKSKLKIKNILWSNVISLW
jgi:hypothetical protein